MTGADEAETVTVTVENLGGIESAEFTFERGVTVLTGRNATNRTSLLRAVGAGLGGSSGELKADADAGSVTLSFDGADATRTFERADGTVRVGGEPFTDDATLVDQYCCLLADNPAREAVERADAGALRECIMAPVDTADLEATVERTRAEIRTLEDDLATARREAERVSAVEDELAERRADLEGVRDELESVREAVADHEATLEAADDAQRVLEELTDAREERERVRDRLETQRRALDSLRDEREAVAADLADATAPTAERDRLQDELERRQRRERELERQVDNLLSIVEFNEDLLDEGVPDAGTDDAPAESADAVVAELAPAGGTVQCWTCGTAVDRGAIDDRLDDLRDVVDEKRHERNELRTEIADLRSELQDVRSAIQHHSALEADLEDVEAEIEERESRVERLEARLADLDERVETLETTASEAEALQDSDLLERYERLSELEYERGQLEEAVDALEAELAEARDAAERVDELEDELDQKRQDLETARTRIENLEREAVETFNEHMATVLDLLGYGNVERVWIERAGRVEDGAVAESEFVLHVVRSTAEGAVYEDTVAHLSESERAVIGLVVALAGYLVHDVHEAVPVMALDSLEAIDAGRIASLVEYFADFPPFLLVALLPEDAAALPERYRRVAMDQAPA